MRTFMLSCLAVFLSSALAIAGDDSKKSSDFLGGPLKSIDDIQTGKDTDKKKDSNGEKDNIPANKSDSKTPVVRSNDYWKSLGGRFKEESNTVEKAKKIANAVANQMASDGISPNYSYVTRLESAVKYGDQETATCGYLSKAVQMAFIGSGFRKEQTDIIIGYKQNLDKLNAGWVFDVNLNHAAPVLVIEGVPYNFDIWMHAGKVGFSGFELSVFNGITTDAWGNMMRELGYSGFTIDSKDMTPQILTSIIEELIDNARLIIFVVKCGDKKVAGAKVKIISNTIPKKYGAFLQDTDANGEAPFKQLSLKVMANDLYDVTVTAEGYQEFNVTTYVDLAKKWTYPVDIMKKIDVKLKISAPATANISTPVHFLAEDDADETVRKSFAYEWVDKSSGDTIGDRREFSKSFILSGPREILLTLYYRSTNNKLTKLAEAKHDITIVGDDAKVPDDATSTPATEKSNVSLTVENFFIKIPDELPGKWKIVMGPESKCIGVGCSDDFPDEWMGKITKRKNANSADWPEIAYQSFVVSPDNCKWNAAKENFDNDNPQGGDRWNGVAITLLKYNDDNAAKEALKKLVSDRRPRGEAYTENRWASERDEIGFTRMGNYIIYLRVEGFFPIFPADYHLYSDIIDIIRKKQNYKE